MAVIPGVSDGELIRTTWGDAVADELNNETIKRNGATAMTGMLTLSATAPSSANHAVNKTYADTKLSLTGGQVDGGVWLNSGQTRVGNELLIVDTVGDPFLSAYVSFYGVGPIGTPGTRRGYIGFPGSNNLYVVNENAGGTVEITATAGAIHLGVLTTEIYVHASLVGFGKVPDNGYNAGVEIWTGGSGAGRIMSTLWSSDRNVWCGHNGGADVNGSSFIDFVRSNVQIGGIYQVGATGTGYGTTSDHRMKTVVGPIVNAVERFRQLRPWRVTWNDDPGRGEVDAFIAHEVDEVVPEAVNGVKDAVAGPPPMIDDPNNPGTEIPDPIAPEEGAIIPQQLDQARLIPLLTAALQEALDKIDALEARIDVLEAA